MPFGVIFLSVFLLFEHANLWRSTTHLNSPRTNVPCSFLFYFYFYFGCCLLFSTDSSSSKERVTWWSLCRGTPTVNTNIPREGTHGHTLSTEDLLSWQLKRRRRITAMSTVRYCFRSNVWVRDTWSLWNILCFSVTHDSTLLISPFSDSIFDPVPTMWCVYPTSRAFVWVVAMVMLECVPSVGMDDGSSSVMINRVALLID